MPLILMKKELILAILLIFLISLASGIRINEVEQNPFGVDGGNEWIELYASTEVNLEGWRIVNGDGKEIWLNGIFVGFFVVDLEKQWLDNNNEKVLLYNGNKLVHEVDKLDDDENDDYTWQVCNELVFVESTKLHENDCKVKDMGVRVVEKEEVVVEEENKTNDIIRLNAVSEGEIVFESKNQKIKEYAVYGFAIFLILVIVILILRD